MAQRIDIKRIFTLLLDALAMVVVALISAFIAMRLAIHGREAVVPALIGLTVADASKAATGKGLDLTLEDRFYSSDVPAGRILAQDPAPGSRVRREWPVRITESLGIQRVNIPDLTGESERAASVTVRRLSLDLGTVAYLALAGDPDVVLSQTPHVNSAGVDGPRVSLLVSDPDDVDSAAYVMPSLAGLGFAAAAERAGAAGLQLVVVPNTPSLQSIAATPSLLRGGAPPPVPAEAAGDLVTGGIVIAQVPLPGSRVVAGDAVRVTLNRPTVPPAAVPTK